MTPLANELARLISPFHYLFTAGAASIANTSVWMGRRDLTARLTVARSPACRLRFTGLYGRERSKSTHSHACGIAFPSPDLTSR